MRKDLIDKELSAVAWRITFYRERALAAFQRCAVEEYATQASFARAFRGDLVPTEVELASREGRSYETTGELLSRIKTATATQQGKAGVARRGKQSRGAKVDA